MDERLITLLERIDRTMEAHLALAWMDALPQIHPGSAEWSASERWAMGQLLAKRTSDGSIDADSLEAEWMQHPPDTPQ